MALEGSPSGDPEVGQMCSKAQRSAAQRRARAAADRGVAAARSEVEQLKAKLELLQQSRTADQCAQQAIDALGPPPELRDELATRLRSRGAALLVPAQLDAGLGATSHRLGDAIRSVERLLDVHPEVSTRHVTSRWWQTSGAA